MTVDQAFQIAFQHHQAGQFPQAEQLYRQILAQQPQHAGALHNLGVLAAIAGRSDIALDLIRRAATLRPDDADILTDLGNALSETAQLEPAITAHRQALALRPQFAEAHNNLGNVLCQTGQLDDAIAAFRQASTLKPQFVQSYANLGNALKDCGQLDQAIAAYRQALALAPRFHQVHSNLVHTLHFHPAYDSKAIAQELSNWSRQHADPVHPITHRHLNDPNPDRRLRIGYVSPDFRDHCQSSFTIPLLSHHDHQHFEIFCYATVRQPDATTIRIQAYADTWRPTNGFSDERLAQLVYDDRIDILIDLTMHMSNGRPLLFARKPAPVQVAYLAYPGSTGLSAMDYRFTDPYLDPPNDTDAHYTERSIVLPDSFWCYDPLTTNPTPGILPALRNGYITFGCLNNFCKVSDQTLSLWGKCLAATPDSRLLLLCPLGNHRKHALDQLARHNIAEKRIEFAKFQPKQAYLELYRRIDLGLETFPYNGHTTSLDSFWMGVPVPTLPGKTAVGRGGLSILSNLGLPELIAHSEEEYIRIATDLAHDLPRLTNLRSTLRQRMENSPLMDAPRFTRNVEAAYRQMWTTWTKSPSKI